MRITPERGFVDHLLAIVCCVTSSYAIAISVNKSELAIFLAVVVGLSCLAGYGLATTFEGTKVINADGWLFTISALVAVGMTRNVNGMLPEEGFPFQIIASVILWLIMVGGGLFAWRDGTLLFLSLPGIALFGLVGVINDSLNALSLFCVFLVSVAVLYARVHQRVMLDEAARSGADTRLLWRDAWKWVAGPEWAFAAAASVIVLSFAAAPLVQFSLRGVTSQVGSNVQRSVAQSIQNRLQPASQVPDTRIGNGPVSLDETPIFDARLDRPRYLRNQIFTDYTGSGWNARGGNSQETLPIDRGQTRRMPEDYVDYALRAEGAEEIDYTLRAWIRTTAPTAFAPGLIVEAPNNGRYLRKNGVASFTTAEGGTRDYNFRVVVTPEDGVLDPYDDPNSRSYVSTSRIPVAVEQLAVELAGSVSSDYAKAQILEQAIADRTKYNLRAGATPPNTDPVEYFLFEQREGYCDVFASSMVLMARSVGLRARYVTGYIVNDDAPDEEGFYTVRNRDYHAWAEVFIDGRGWVPFDATKYAEEVEGAGVGETASPFDIFMANIPWGTVSTVAFALLAGGLAIIWVLNFRNAANQVNIGLRGDIVHLQNWFQKGLESHLRHPRRFSQTIREFVEVANPALGPLAPKAAELASAYERGMFGPGEPAKAEIKALRDQTRDFLAALKKHPRTKA